jgi:hypothetical protein
MADFKPLGSEKLNGDDKLKRILELTYFNNNKKTSTFKAELVSESKVGGVYGIVREKDAYYVKRGLNEQSLDYIGGMFMKNKNKFSSYAEAFKRLDYIKGQEELQEATKYVLKQNKPSQDEAPIPEPSIDTPPPPPTDGAPADTMGSNPSSDAAPSGDMGTAPTDDMGSAPTNDMGGMSGDDTKGGDDEEQGPSKRSDYMSEVQKYAGKLGQELRDLHDRMESDDIKYVLNMIISACDLDKLSDKDIEEIGKKFDRDEEGQSGEEMPSEPSTEDSGSDFPPPPSSDQEMSENAMNSLDEFINSPTPHEQNEIDLSNYVDDTDDMSNHADLEKGNNDGSEMGGEDHLEEIDLDEIKNAIGETLSKYFKH